VFSRDDMRKRLTQTTRVGKYLFAQLDGLLRLRVHDCIDARQCGIELRRIFGSFHITFL
jgi:hypothetical protein